MSELLPCPFCGGKAETRTSTWNVKNYKWTVQCNTNGCMGEVGCAFYRTEAEAIGAWNTRAETVTVVTGITTVTDAPQITYVPERTCQQEERGWGTEGDHARVWLTCGHDCMVPTVQDLPNYCPTCGCKVVSE